MVLCEECFGFEVAPVGFANVDRVGDLDKEVLSESCGETDCVEFRLGFGVRDEDRDERLGDVPRGAGGAPGLSERKESLGAGWGSIGECVVFEAWAEILSVIEDLCTILFPQGVALGTGMWAGIHDRST